MEGEVGRGRGRGRGMVPGSNEERGDLRRPLATPQEVSVIGMPQPQQQNPIMGVSSYNDENAGANSQYVVTQSQLNQIHDSMRLQHAQIAQQQQQQMRQTQMQQQHDPRLQSQLNLMSQQSPHIQVLPLQLQQQQQQQQSLHQQQQLQQQQLVHQISQVNAQQQLVQLGTPQGNLSSYLSPENRQIFNDLQRRSAELECILSNKQRIQSQQQQQQQQQHQQHQQLQALRNSQQTLEIEQKLASLQLQNPNAIYLQPAQQHQVQQQQIQQQQQQQQQQLQLQKQQQIQFFQKQLLQQQQQQERFSVPTSMNADNSRSSVLSAEAAEFVPRFGSMQQAQHSDGNMSAAVVAANHHQEQPMTMTPTTAGHPQEQVSLIPIQPEYMSHPVLIQVDNAIVQLSANPSKYEAISRQLTSVLSWQVKEENLMREIVTLIFEQGVGEANFRFTGGKLCEHLVKNVAQLYNGLSFKSILLQRCQEEFEYRHEYLLMQHHHRLVGYSFFLAEVLTRLVMPSGQPILKLKEALCVMLTLLLDVSTNDGLKCVAQVLKMSGRLLEMGSSAEVENVMVKLRDIAMTPIPPNIKTLLMSVVEFRASNWGCGPEDAGGGSGSGGEEGSGGAGTKDTAGGGGGSGDQADVNGEDLPVLGTIFYGPDGVIHHIEEDCVEDYPSEEDDSASTGAPISNKHLPAPQVCELEGEEGAAFDQFLQSMT